MDVQCLMRPDTPPDGRAWMSPTGPGCCRGCGRPLGEAGQRYWIVEHPHGWHEGCRPWEAEPFPFHGDLERLRALARQLRTGFRSVLRDGQWLAGLARGWPARAKRGAVEWGDRRRRLEHQLGRLRERLRW